MTRETSFERLIKYYNPKTTHSRRYRKTFNADNDIDLSPEFRELNEEVIQRSVNWFRNRPACDHDCLLGRVSKPQRTIVKDILCTFLNEEQERIVEFGCGAYGILYNFMIPGEIRRKYTQFDINPWFLDQNKNFSLVNFLRFPDLRVGNIYDMPIEDESVDVIIGLSSWDSIAGPEKTIPEIERCLRPGGYFIHFQDIIPANYPILIAEIMKRESRGLKPKFECEYISRITHKLSGLRTRENILIGIESIDSGIMENTSRYLTNNLANVCKERGMKIYFNKEITATSIQKRSKYNKITWKLRRLNELGKNNVIEKSPCNHISYSYDSSIPNGYVSISTSMDSVVAKKKL